MRGIAVNALEEVVGSDSVCQKYANPELGVDISNLLEVPLLGNRVDRFVWDGQNLTFDDNLIMLRAFQNDAAPIPPNQGDQNQPVLGNHDGGVLRFGGMANCISWWAM
jgi:hypothetical protein